MIAILQPPRNSPFPERDFALEGLRGVCALLVAYAHMTGEVALDPAYMPAILVVNCGMPAVIIFFVISGYVIGLTVRNPATRGNVRHYCVSRVLRIVPVAWLAVLLSVAIMPESFKVTAANLLFVQNNGPYPFGISLPVLGNNMSFWSLSNEMLYYSFFIVIWKFAPRLRFVVFLVFIFSFAYIIGFPKTFSIYAYFFSYWLAGLCIAWYAKPAAVGAHSSWITALAGAFALWTIGPLQTLFQWFVPPFIGSTYCRWDFMIGAVSVVLAVVRRAPRLQAGLANLCAFLGIGVLVLKMLNGTPNSTRELLAGAVLGVCLLLRTWHPSLRPLARLKPLGQVSYAFYATAAPLLFLVRGSSILPSGSFWSLGLRTVVYAVLCGGTAWLLEGVFQPWLTGLSGIRRLRGVDCPQPA